MFGWIRIAFASSAFVVIIFSLSILIVFSAVYRGRLQLLKKTSKQYYNSHLKICSKMYVFLGFIQLVIALFELSEVIGHSVINSNREIFHSATTTNSCAIHEFTTMAALHNTDFFLLFPPITPNLIYPLLLTLVYCFLMFTTKLFSLNHTKGRYVFILHICIWGTIQTVFLLVLYSNPWTLVAAPFVFTLFVIIDFTLFSFYAFYLKRILCKCWKDTMCYTDSTQDIAKIRKFYLTYKRGMFVFVIAFFLLSLSVVLAALFDGMRSLFLNICFYNISPPEIQSTGNEEASKILIIGIIIMKFASMIIFDIFVITSCVIISVKVISFYRELCFVAKQQSTKPLLRNY